ncbi:MAG: ABC transporter ATP-binding protein [Desulfobacteraceae bacterium]|jgi:lipoprotein-releasing system ATP-binding protein|nr:ABC transporter ATP-binding protein [Desulfobacteraceae bacterium]
MAETVLKPSGGPAEAPAKADPAPGPLLRAVGIRKSYHGNGSHLEVLCDLDFELNGAETVAVVGASGIGKSTLLHILGTLDRPEAGRLFYRGEDVFRYDDLRLARFRNASIGFVFQFHHLLPEFSALENVMMPALINGQERQAAQALARQGLVRVGLEARLDYRVNKLSGGEQQRVALARALVLKPALLLADEPTGNLDQRNSEEVHRLLLELNREVGMALVVVTHNPELASFMGRRVTIADGKLVETG